MIETHESHLANLRNTREVAPPLRSAESTNIGIKLTILIISIIGMIFSIFTALFVEFTTKVKEKVQMDMKQS